MLRPATRHIFISFIILFLSLTHLIGIIRWIVFFCFGSAGIALKEGKWQIWTIWWNFISISSSLRWLFCSSFGCLNVRGKMLFRPIFICLRNHSTLQKPSITRIDVLHDCWPGNNQSIRSNFLLTCISGIWMLKIVEKLTSGSFGE